MFVFVRTQHHLAVKTPIPLPAINDVALGANVCYNTREVVVIWIKTSSTTPSLTLPCHFSMSHSVPPQRHGILTNTYVPQVHPVDGIFEKIKNAGGISAMFYGWEPLRDIAPTIAVIMGIESEPEWEGKPLLNREKRGI